MATHKKIAAVYQVRCGPVFYIGSTTDLTKRKSEHHSKLKWGEHPNRNLQAAFNEHGSFDCSACKYFHQKPDESAADFKERLKSAEQMKLDECFRDPLFKNNIANHSTSSRYNSGIGEAMKEKWQDPEFRAVSIERLKRMHKTPVSDETRAKMAEKKRGANSPVARKAYIVTPSGERMEFPTGKAVADFLGVGQQVAHGWLSGVFAWPGKGRKPCRQQYERLIGYSGGFV